MDYPTTRTIRAKLDVLASSPQTAEQQIADMAMHVKAAIAQALADPTIDRTALAEQLEERARWAS